MLFAPGVPNAAEAAEMSKLVDTYGKTWHTWQVDRGDTLPLGETLPCCQPGKAAGACCRPLCPCSMCQGPRLMLHFRVAVWSCAQKVLLAQGLRSS